MKNILGLDLGTNSIGWAKISTDDEGNYLHKMELGSRIIPMSQDVLGKFDSGETVSQTALRTQYRGTRRLRERELLRRERLHRVLHVLNFLPEHYDNAIGWNKNQSSAYGKFLNHEESKIAWRKNQVGKMEFLFMDSFKEMLADFAVEQPSVVADGKKVPLDWTIYYLRKKALTKAISKHELAWIILNFNQKRGYYQLRGEDEEETTNKQEEYYQLKVVRVEQTAEMRAGSPIYNIYFENGWVYTRPSKTSLMTWENQIIELIVTTDLDETGNPKLDKDGKVRRSFRAPKEDDWTLLKKRTEKSIANSGKTVGEYIYDSLLAKPAQKIRGKLVRTVERAFYKDELTKILIKQMEFIPELRNELLFMDCVRELYPRNKAHQDSLQKKDFVYFLINDIIFYQRALKSKKSLISNCPYESYPFVDKSTGEIKQQHIKVIAKSNPYFQEFRTWQFIQNLRIISTEGLHEKDVTVEFLPDVEAYVQLYRYLSCKKEIGQDTFLKEFCGLKKPKGKDAKIPFRWNYVEDKIYPCNETRAILLKAFEKAGISSCLLTSEMEYRLWHLLYSVEDKKELTQALVKFAAANEFPETFVEELKKVPSFKKEYGAYSEKAIKKLLSVMRVGSMWSADNLSPTVYQRIQSILEGKETEVLEKARKQNVILEQLENFQGLSVSLACYVVYGRHSEVNNIVRWKTPADLKAFICGFKQSSMRNPIVEQCVLETLRTVHDIWEKSGHIDEIHVELGRSMKSTADQRKKMTRKIMENENTNERIKLLLMELKNDADIEDVRPYSPMQQEILKIYEEGALSELSSKDPEFTEILRISHLAQPTGKEIQKYKLWLEQKYRSPYTGRVIPLAKLFTSAYQIEHVIPQSRFFDDSLPNKVICEAEVNQRKSNMLGMEFIKKCGGEKIQCANQGLVTVLDEKDYLKFIEDHYAHNRGKKERLLMEDIPDKFIERQMNDTRYISSVIKSLLSNVVREESEQEATSKNLIPCTGGITDRLKQDWGLNDIWNRIVTPRFERMNSLTNSDAFGHWENKEGKRVFQTTIPLELQRGFSKKRIDHRHHAMDALVIALANRNIVGFLNNESAKDTKRRRDLQYLLCDKNRTIKRPWDTFTQDAYHALSDVVISFKNYVRVINKASNYYQHFDEHGKKIPVAQHGDAQWAIRKPMHKETVFARVNLKRTKIVTLNKALDQVSMIVDKNLKKEIRVLMEKGMDKKKIVAYFKALNYQFKGADVSKVGVYYYSEDDVPMVATRKALDDSFDKKKIESITDTGIQKILLNYLESKGNNPKEAFSPEGIMEMNEHIAFYNDGKSHQPILKVRVSETLGEKYPVGYNGNKGSKYVKAQSGTNLFVGIYENNEGVRSYQTISFAIAAERFKQGLSPVPEINDVGVPLKFYLSPNDLVYVPTEEEKAGGIVSMNKERIYKMVSSTESEIYFVPNYVANVLMKKVEFNSKNKMEKTIEGVVIKANCWKLEVDRLGEIIKIIK